MGSGSADRPARTPGGARRALVVAAAAALWLSAPSPAPAGGSVAEVVDREPGAGVLLGRLGRDLGRDERRRVSDFARHALFNLGHSRSKGIRRIIENLWVPETVLAETAKKRLLREFLDRDVGSLAPNEAVDLLNSLLYLFDMRGVREDDRFVGRFSRTWERDASTGYRWEARLFLLPYKSPHPNLEPLLGTAVRDPVVTAEYVDERTTELYGFRIKREALPAFSPLHDRLLALLLRIHELTEGDETQMTLPVLDRQGRARTMSEDDILKADIRKVLEEARWWNALQDARPDERADAQADARALGWADTRADAQTDARAPRWVNARAGAQAPGWMDAKVLGWAPGPPGQKPPGPAIDTAPLLPLEPTPQKALESGFADLRKKLADETCMGYTNRILNPMLQ